MEFNIRTLFFCLMATCLFLSKFLGGDAQEHPQVHPESSILSDKDFFEKQTILQDVLSQSWYLFEGNDMYTARVLQLNKDYQKETARVHFSPDKTIRKQSPTAAKVFSETLLGHWYLEGEFLFLVFQEPLRTQDVAVRIFQFQDVKPSELHVREIRNYKNYQEFNEKFEQHLETIQDGRHHICQTNTLDRAEKIVQLIKLQDEFFNYPD